MPFLMDKILTEYADQAFETTRLRRNGVQTTRDLVSAETLIELEAAGDAMRFVDTNGQIAWKATPSLRDYLRTLNSMPKTILRTCNNALPGIRSSPFQPKHCKRTYCACKMNGKRFKPAVTGMRSMDI